MKLNKRQLIYLSWYREQHGQGQSWLNYLLIICSGLKIIFPKTKDAFTTQALIEEEDKSGH